MTTPIWLLDVDGVLNAIVRALPAGYVEGKACPFENPTTRDHYYDIKFNPDVIAQIEKWHQDKLVEVRWLTTWGEGANWSLRELLGFAQEFGVVAEPPVSSGYSPWSGSRVWWKLPAAQAVRAENPDAPIVWTDDDLPLYPDAREWAKENNVLAIAPSQYTGLVKADFDRIETYLKQFI